MALRPMVQFGCLHLGNKDTDYKLAYAYRDFVARRPDAMALLNGDNFDACIPCHKPQTMWNQKETPQEQYEKGLEFYRPIADKVVGACTSNHSDRIWKATSLDLDKNLARELGFLKRYVGVLGVQKVVVGKVQYHILLLHGQSAGVDLWRDAQKALNIYPYVDLVCLSHTHEMGSKTHAVFSKSGMRKVYLSRTGSVINYPRYAKQALYQPKVKGFTIVWLDDRKKRIRFDTSGEVPDVKAQC